MRVNRIVLAEGSILVMLTSQPKTGLVAAGTLPAKEYAKTRYYRKVVNSFGFAGDEFQEIDSDSVNVQEMNKLKGTVKEF